MIDADLSFIRRVELFKASNSQHPLKVFFMVYDNSIEERTYLTEIRKEKDAFEKLINQKGNMVVPINQDGRGMLEDPEETYWHEFDTRNSRNIVTAPEIIVDIREFRSSLPSLIHSKKILIRPCTLEVGDYILSGSMCVERKSINDLVGSLKSGRLYNQAEAMCIHYAIPILLIEFDPGKSFSFSMIRDDAVASVGTSQKLVLLLIHFPKLRIIWSPTPSFTVQVFEALKNKQDEPCMDTAMAAGVESTAFKDTNFNITPIDILKSLPGITCKNFHYIASQVKNLDELMDMKLQDLQDLIGSEQGKKLFNFINFNISLPDVCNINAS
jgi:DNA excision repair protein ERCC-4